jgi:hypothetical protein
MQHFRDVTFVKLMSVPSVTTKHAAEPNGAVDCQQTNRPLQQLGILADDHSPMDSNGTAVFVKDGTT